MSPSKIKISAETAYAHEQSDPLNDQFVFFYSITIANFSDKPCQLLSRHWIITNARQEVEEIYGEGVVGEQPVINAGEVYNYSSGAVITSEIGTMEGRYFMRWLDKNMDEVDFEVDIPRFVLSVPRVLH